MARFFDTLEEKQQAFIKKQHMFFVASAPSEGGRVNLSPKGLDTFRILNDKQVAYLDLTGSGNETAAHLMDNGRLTFMFCSFDKQPLILRLYGKGRSIQRMSPEWDEWMSHFEDMAGSRQIIVMDIDSVQTSCGYAVPYYELKGERPTLVAYSEKKGEDGMVTYRKEKNIASIDGLPMPATDP